MFFKRYTPDSMKKAIPELCASSIWMRELLRILVRSKSINATDHARIEGHGAVVILKISRLLSP